MKKVRYSVFETNSSSSHSLTLVKSELMPLPFSKDVLRQGEILVAVGEYGWEWARYYRPENKLSYLLTQVTSGNLDRRSTEKLIEDYPAIERMARVLKEHTGCDLKIVDSSGYIDHDSEGVAMETLQSDEALRDFLFSEASFIETSNDNDSAPWTITTDKGSELYYQPYFKEVPSDYVHVGAYPGTSYGFSAVCLKTGGYLSESDHPELLEQFEKSAIFVNATLLSPSDENKSSYYDPLERTDPKVYCISHLGGLFDDSALRISANFEAQVLSSSSKFGVTNFNDDPLMLANFAVPKELADALSALPVTETATQMLEDLQSNKVSAVAALKKDPTHHYFQKRLKQQTSAIAFYQKKLKDLKKGSANAN